MGHGTPWRDRQQLQKLAHHNVQLVPICHGPCRLADVSDVLEMCHQIRWPVSYDK